MKSIKLVSILLAGALALTACSDGSAEVEESVKKAAAAHTGEWTEQQMREAVGENGNIVRVETAPDGSGGTVVVETQTSGGTTRTTKKNGRTKRKKSDYETTCVDVTFSGSSASTVTRTEVSETNQPAC